MFQTHSDTLKVFFFFWFITFLFVQQKHTFARKNLRQSKLLDPSPRAVTQTHREFVDGLLSECRLKVRALNLLDDWSRCCRGLHISLFINNGHKIFSWLFRPNGCWWRGWGRRAWNLVREKPTSRACKKTHSSTVCVTYWREPGAMVCSWNRSDTHGIQHALKITDDLQKKQIYVKHMNTKRRLYEPAQCWRVCLS